MKILICPDSMKESLSAEAVSEAISTGILAVWPNAVIDKLPLADGGEGTCDILVRGTQGRIIRKRVHDPLMREKDSFFGILGDEETAVIEMSAASGIELLKEEEKNPLITSTYGTGELILEAIALGCKRIIIGLGGSATNDAGAGMAAALGYQLSDSKGNKIDQGGGSLGKLVSITVPENILNKLKAVEFIAACDVTNPLTGETGSSTIYGPQKGATPEMVSLLDENLKTFARVVERDLGKKVGEVPGAGAAGGLGAGLMAFTGAELKSGFSIVAELLEVEKKIKEADLIITAEGRVDFQTLRGKVPVGISRLAAKYKKPVLVFTGTVGKGAEEIYEEGVSVIIPITESPISLSEAKQRAGELLKNAAIRSAKLMELTVNFKLLT